MIKICSLGSGSRGNSIFIGNDKTKILIDAGFSALKIKNSLEKLGEDISEINAVIITHEHADHIKGIKTLSNSYKIPIFVSSDFPEIFIEKVKNKDFFYSGEDFLIENIEISSFNIPHDAVDPVGFLVKMNDLCIGIATDIGKITNLIVNKLEKCNIIFLEFNHDEKMLLYGPYSWELKQRIRSSYGHLSNSDAIELIKKISNTHLTDIFVSHISQNNNSYEIIKREILKNFDNFNENLKFHFTYQDKPSNLITFP